MMRNKEKLAELIKKQRDERNTLKQKQYQEIDEVKQKYKKIWGHEAEKYEEIKKIEGKKVSERGNYPVVEKKIPQWVLKITQYLPQLLEGLEKLDWPYSMKSLQTNWIGLS